MKRKRIPTCGHHWRRNRGHGMCEECYGKDYYKKNRSHKAILAQKRLVPSVMRDKHFRAKYGIPYADVLAMIDSQNGRCFLCQEECDKLQLDHDHETGINRKMLCGPCNRGLGGFRDNPDVLRKAADYVLLHKPKIKVTAISGEVNPFFQAPER